MFSNHLNYRDQDAKIKGQYQEVGGKTPKDVRKKKMLRRIHEYRKFKANCQRLKEFIKTKQELEEHRDFPQKVKIEFERRSKSYEKNNFHNIGFQQRNCFSMPNLNKNLSLRETIQLWRMKKDR